MNHNTTRNRNSSLPFHYMIYNNYEQILMSPQMYYQMSKLPTETEVREFKNLFDARHSLTIPSSSKESDMKDEVNIDRGSIIDYHKTDSVNYLKPMKNFEFKEEVMKKYDALPYLTLRKENLNYASDISQITIPTHIEQNEMFEVFLSEVNSPSRFWFNIASESQALDELMADIEKYYCSLDMNELLIKEYEIKEGQLCSAIFDGVWHRGEIVGEVHENKVRVYFVDYGTTTRIPITDIKYLLHTFSELPRQALRGTLHGITSNEHRWKRESTSAMLGMVTNVKLYCRVKEIIPQHRIISMILYQTENVSINELLVVRGFAKVINQLHNKNGRKYFVERYPTFESLETGEYPSFEYIGTLLDKGIDFETIDNIEKMYNENSLTTIKAKSTNPFNTSFVENA